jgi:GT2 family glycosyltransferase
MPRVTIVIVCWNSGAHLPRCLSNLSAQTYQDFDVILLDNGSTDGSLDHIVVSYSDIDISIERLGSNRGFAVANNIGARLARGHWLALLNADAFPEPDWLECLLEAAEEYPNAFFSSRQIQVNATNLLDGEGDVYHISGLAWRRNYGVPVYPIDEVEEIFSACGAAAMYLRQDFLDAGGFDEDFFAYQEDVDLSFRLRLLGLRCFYIPQAVIHHVGSASTGKMSDFAIYHGHRNLVWAYLKNMPPPLFWLYLPLHIAMNLYFMFSFTLQGHGKTIFLAKLDALRKLKVIFHKRRVVQRNRQVSTGSIYQMMERNLLAPLLLSIQRRRFKNHRE